MDALARSRVAFRGLPFPARAAIWLVAAFALAVVGLSLERDPVEQSNERLEAYERAQGIQSAQQGGAGAGEKGAPEDAGAPPVKVEGVDRQLGAGATPVEIGARVPKGVRADAPGVRRLFAATLGRRGRVGQHRNTLESVSCRSGRCRIAYVPDGPGAGRVLETQGPLWAGLASDPRWRSATITALPVRRGGGRKVIGSRTSIACTREGLARVGKWGVQSAPKIRRFCRVGR